jgi:hypothetical protein
LCINIQKEEVLVLEFVVVTNVADEVSLLKELPQLQCLGHILGVRTLNQPAETRPNGKYGASGAET